MVEFNEEDIVCIEEDKVVERLEQYIKTVFSFWFFQFDFPDEKGKPYKTDGGKMIWDETLGMEIPSGWRLETIKNISKGNRGVSYTASSLSDTKNGICLMIQVEEQCMNYC